MKTLVIDRDKWGRGQGFIESELLNARTGKMCCIGFLALSCGYTQREITGVGEVNTLTKEGQRKDELAKEINILSGDPLLADTFYLTNDAHAYLGAEVQSEAAREGRLKEMFAKELDTELKFVN
jgi:hypothetical protein